MRAGTPIVVRSEKDEVVWATRRRYCPLVRTSKISGSTGFGFGYLHARPNTSSGLKLDEGIFR
jgi:hypothetical protein